MKDVFDIPASLMDAIATVNPAWRRDLDIRPLVLIAGLNRSKLIEVHQGHSIDFELRSDDAQRVHELLAIKGQLNHRVIHSLSHYSGSGYDKINQALWHSYLHGSEVPSDVRSHSDNILSVMHKEVHVGGLKLYTGVKESPATSAGLEWNSTRPIKLLHLPAFTSTSTSFDIAESFSSPDVTSEHHESDHHGTIEAGASHILELHYPNKIHRAASIVDYSGAKHEEEVLLGPNHTFELHPRPTRIEHRGPVYVWKATYRGINDHPMFRTRF